MDNSQSKRKPYVRPVEKGWWLKNSFYIHYMLREGTSLFVSIYAVILLVGLLRLSQGPDAWAGWLAALTHPLSVLFHLAVLAACLFHAKTWFALAPKAMRVMHGEEPIPDRPIVLAQYIALGAVSVIVLLVTLLA
ncbi:fumarate reductase subunit C [Pseudaeromonas sharmana]|uniref:Fumarate reductase subunit C n=1 Tax=Pseudaeromonas sharmana TaxID=328412 RepID=A0ABV8CLQ5_9GAMM